MIRRETMLRSQKDNLTKEIGRKYKVIELKKIAITIAILSSSQVIAGYADDRAEIEDLMSRYIFALDLKDVESYTMTFTQDGIIDHAEGVERGREEIRDFIQGSADSAAATYQTLLNQGKSVTTARHNINNLELKIDGDTGSGRAYWTSVRVNEDGLALVSEYGFYEDEYLKVDGQWFFSKRTIINEFRPGRTQKDIGSN